jgi:hypothetical protein
MISVPFGVTIRRQVGRRKPGGNALVDDGLIRRWQRWPPLAERTSSSTYAKVLSVPPKKARTNIREEFMRTVVVGLFVA